MLDIIFDIVSIALNLAVVVIVLKMWKEKK